MGVPMDRDKADRPLPTEETEVTTQMVEAGGIILGRLVSELWHGSMDRGDAAEQVYRAMQRAAFLIRKMASRALRMSLSIKRIR